MWSLRRSGSVRSSDLESSLGSNAVSSETSTGPSRLESFSNGPSRLDSFNQSVGQVPTTDLTTQTSFDDGQITTLTKLSPMSSASPSSCRECSRGKKGTTSTTNSTKTDHSSNEPDEGDSTKPAKPVSPMIQKWVEESCAETERRKESGSFDSGSLKAEEVIKEEVASPDVEFALQRAFEYSLRSASPSYMRGGSLDGTFAGLADLQSQLNPTENMLLGLGFGGPDLGIPVRFLKSWRERLIKQQINQLQGMLAQNRRSPSPIDSTRQYQAKPPEPRESTTHTSSRSPYVAEPTTKVKESHQKVEQVESKPGTEHGDRQVQLEKLRQMRQQMRRSATFSSFSPNQLPNVTDPRKVAGMSEKKYKKFRNATRGSAKDRRRAFGARQSSLPVSLATLHEEDEDRPAFLQQKSSSLDNLLDNNSSFSVNDSSYSTSMNSSRHDIAQAVALECHTRDAGIGEGPLDVTHKGGPRIITSRPSTCSVEGATEGRETISEQKSKGVQEQKYDDQKLLVIRKIIESKDSGFGNDISNGGSPILSPKCGTTSPGADDFVDGNQGEQGLVLRGNQNDKASDHKIVRVDSCIQVDFPKSDSSECSSRSDTEYSSTGVQTSPWLQSGELSPLCWGPSLRDASTHSADEVTGASESVAHGARESCLDVRDLSDEEFMKYCDDILEKHGKKENGEQNEDRILPEFPDGFSSEKRRLSRIEEATESSLSHQSEEELVKANRESQQDGSLPGSSSSTRTASSMLVSDIRVSNEEPPSGTPKLQNESRKLRKKMFQEMLTRNTESGLMAESMRLRIQPSQHVGRCPTQLTVTETLTKVAQKLELCIANDIIGMDGSVTTECDSSDLLEEGHPVLKLSPTSGKPPANQQPTNLHSHSGGLDPGERSRSEKCRRFFSSSSFLSFSDSVGHLDRSDASAESELSDAASFFSMPVLDDDGEEYLNFSLTGSDLTFRPQGPTDCCQNDTTKKYFNENGFDSKMCTDLGNQGDISENTNASTFIADIPKITRSFDNSICDEFAHSISTSNSKEEYFLSKPSTLAYSDEMKDEHVDCATSSKSVRPIDIVNTEIFTQHLDIVVPPRNVSFSTHILIPFLQRPAVICADVREQSSTICQTRKYSSRYYCSVEGHFRDSEEAAFKGVRNALLERRKSLMEAHLSARQHVFDEIIESRDFVTGTSPSFFTSRESTDNALNKGDVSTGVSKPQIKHAKFMVGGFKNKPDSKNYLRVDGVAMSDGDDDSDRGQSPVLTLSRVDSYVDGMLEQTLQSISENELEIGTINKQRHGIESSEGTSPSPSPVGNIQIEGQHAMVVHDGDGTWSAIGGEAFVRDNPRQSLHLEAKLNRIPDDQRVAAGYGRSPSIHPTSNVHLPNGTRQSGCDDRFPHKTITDCVQYGGVIDSMCEINLGPTKYRGGKHFTGSSEETSPACSLTNGVMSHREACLESIQGDKTKEKCGSPELNGCIEQIRHPFDSERDSENHHSLMVHSCKHDGLLAGEDCSELSLLSPDTHDKPTDPAVSLSYGELHSRAEKLISNLNALIAGNQ